MDARTRPALAILCVRLKGQGENTTGPVPSHMLTALITTIRTTKIAT